MTASDAQVGRSFASPHVARMLGESLRPASLTQSTDAINLAIGEPDMAPPHVVTNALAWAVQAGHTHYVDQAGDPELRDAVAAHESARTGRPVARANVQITSGGTGAIGATILGLVGPGDRVVMPDPTYSLYADLVRLAGGVAVPVRTLPDHHLDLEALGEALPGARLFAYCSPVNPTGVVYTRAELEGLGHLLEGTDTLVLDDAAYSTMVYDPFTYTSALDVAGLADRTVFCQTFSKAYAMTGFRIGYIVAPEELLAPVGAVHRTFLGAVNSAVQKAAVTALAEGDEFIEATTALYQGRLRLGQELVDSVPELTVGPAEGSFYLFARIRGGHASADVARHLHENGVKVRAGSEFGAGGEGHLRISCSVTGEALERAFDRIRTAMPRLSS